MADKLGAMLGGQREIEQVEKRGRETAIITKRRAKQNHCSRMATVVLLVHLQGLEPWTP